MSDVVLRQKVGIPAGIDERVVDAGGGRSAQPDGILYDFAGGKRIS